MNGDRSTIVIQENDICAGSSSFECHMYVEHIHLTNTKILIETGSSSSARPVVIHLELPRANSRKSENLSGNITLGDNSLFCGVNNGSTNCNGKPERFVIAASARDLNCEATSHVSNCGDSLPHAVLCEKHR